MPGHGLKVEWNEILTVWCEVWNGGAEFRVQSLREDGESPQSACLNGARVSQGTVSVLVRRSASYPKHLALIDRQEWWSTVGNVTCFINRAILKGLDQWIKDCQTQLQCVNLFKSVYLKLHVQWCLVSFVSWIHFDVSHTKLQVIWTAFIPSNKNILVTLLLSYKKKKKNSECCNVLFIYFFVFANVTEAWEHIFLMFSERFETVSVIIKMFNVHINKIFVLEFWECY